MSCGLETAPLARGGGWPCVLAWAAVTECQSLGGLNDQHLFLIVLEAVKSQIKVPADLVWGEGPLPRLQMAALLLWEQSGMCGVSTEFPGEGRAHRAGCPWGWTLTHQASGTHRPPLQPGSLVLRGGDTTGPGGKSKG